MFLGFINEFNAGGRGRRGGGSSTRVVVTISEFDDTGRPTLVFQDDGADSIIEKRVVYIYMDALLRITTDDGDDGFIDSNEYHTFDENGLILRISRYTVSTAFPDSITRFGYTSTGFGLLF